MKPFGLIYKITNSLNGKMYIGQTIRSAELRFKQHVMDALNPKRRHFAIHRAIQKYGAAAFKVEILLHASSKEALDHWEQYFIGKNNAFYEGYNLTAQKSAGGHSIETRKKIGEKAKLAATWKIATVAASLHNTGKPCSDQTRKRISEAKKGRVINSVETRAKMSLAKKGKPSPTKGKVLSLETKAKISLSLKNKEKPWVSHEARQLAGQKNRENARKKNKFL